MLQNFTPSEKIENINGQYWTLHAKEGFYIVMPCFTERTSLVEKVSIFPWVQWVILSSLSRFRRRRKTLVLLTA
jgi:peptidoglycan/LPS O-acetylase OafA/YrhL